MTELIEFVCPCARGTEKMLRFELKALGATDLTGDRGAVLGRGPLSLLADVNVFTRIASRIYWVQARFIARSEKELLDQLADHPFEDIVDARSTIAVHAHLNQAPWDHTLYAAQRTKDAIIDRLRDRGIGRPDVDPLHPEVGFVLHWDQDQVTLSLDATGAALHKRRYRVPGGVAPMRETLAASVLAIGHADVRRPFYDPCCGTGTLAIEQCLRSLKRAPGKGGRYSYQRWRFVPPELQQASRDAVTRAFDEELHKLTAPIFLSDYHPKAVGLAEEQIAAAGLTEFLKVERADARNRDYVEESPVICSNLPFGERLGGETELQLKGFYRTLGDRLRTVDGGRIILFTSQHHADELLDLGHNKRWKLFSGPIRATLYRWDNPRGPRPADPPSDSTDDAAA